MRGRVPAMIVASTCTASVLLAWIGAAAVALVVLRFGVNASMAVVMAALIPGGIWAYLGEPGPLTTIVAIVVLAEILRLTRAWSLVLVALPLVVAAWCLSLLYLAPDYVAQLVMQLQHVAEQLFARLNEQRTAASQTPLSMAELPGEQQLLGMFGLMQTMTCLLSLLFARWWQAALYNPGGFREEFHQLRLGRVQVVILVAGLVLLSYSEAFRVWSWLFAVPLCVAGIALAHGLAGIHTIARQWLVVFYIALVFFAPIVPLLMMLAIADSALDFRNRWRPDS